MSIDMSSNLPPSQPRDLFASAPALSLSLAGIFQGGGGEVEEGEGGIGGDAVEISSENSGAGKSRSDDYYELAAEGLMDDEDEDENDGGGGKKRKRKKYHRHTPQQIREMEAYVSLFSLLHTHTHVYV
ncbi:homeobox-leucine zipper protein GLABRA 2-like [Salvia miltiorrhiza]|uniref:homeobox-leucine zipper protein GLABRA 2-like n=1 Tax=Salvia miltiorrhiza TaxID=226208 RepID=UPI0025AC061D|nr:homeobox-leucine zipper protein GLABRA 2-like [Salvia miltiorrhiza]